MIRSTTRVPAAALALFILFGTEAGFSMANAAECRFVRGGIEETQETGAGCTSPVGLCTVGQMSGPLTGQARFTASAFITSADTPSTGVVFVTGDTTIDDARLGLRRGTLIIKNAAAYRTVGSGDLTDTQVIVGGTGDFSDASGALRASGTFVDGGGTAIFEGTICVP